MQLRQCAMLYVCMYVFMDLGCMQPLAMIASQDMCRHAQIHSYMHSSTTSTEHPRAHEELQQ